MGWLVRQVLRKKRGAIDMTKVSDDDFERVVLEHEIFGRVTPEQKQKMVTVLQNAGKQLL